MQWLKKQCSGGSHCPMHYQNFVWYEPSTQTRRSPSASSTKACIFMDIIFNLCLAYALGGGGGGGVCGGGGAFCDSQKHCPARNITGNACLRIYVKD